VAGVNDVFSGYDGGWLTGVPYVITLVRGDGAVTYRIASRAEVRDGVRYALCPGGTPSVSSTPDGAAHPGCARPRRVRSPPGSTS
jgi:hypothetical protein